MSYGFSEALQVAVFDVLQNDAGVAALTSGAVFDAMPTGSVPPIYVALGDEEVRDKSDVSGLGAEHDFVVSVISAVPGFRQAKALAAVVDTALHGTAPALSVGVCSQIQFLKARAYRDGDGDARRIDLTFRARISS